MKNIGISLDATAVEKYYNGSRHVARSLTVQCFPFIPKVGTCMINMRTEVLINVHLVSFGLNCVMRTILNFWEKFRIFEKLFVANRSPIEGNGLPGRK